MCQGFDPFTSVTDVFQVAHKAAHSTTALFILSLTCWIQIASYFMIYGIWSSSNMSRNQDYINPFSQVREATTQLFRLEHYWLYYALLFICYNLVPPSVFWFTTPNYGFCRYIDMI